MKNYETISSMSVDQLAVFCEFGCPPNSLCPLYHDGRSDHSRDDCVNHWREWLNAEVDANTEKGADENGS